MRAATQSRTLHFLLLAVAVMMLLAAGCVLWEVWFEAPECAAHHHLSTKEK